MRRRPTYGYLLTRVNADDVDGKAARHRNIALAVALAAVVAATVIYLSRPGDGTESLSAGATEQDPQAPLASAAEPASETFQGQLRGASASETHEFGTLMADGRLVIDCSFNPQGLNPGVRYLLQLREGNGEWKDAGGNSCAQSTTTPIQGPSTARVRVEVAEGGICACDYTVTLRYEPAGTT